MLGDNCYLAWEIPFFVFLLCVYLYYRWNLFRECQVIDKAAAGWEMRKSQTAAVMRPCFLDCLAQNAGQNNIFFMAACLLLGGAGSLFWMVIWSPVCIFLRFVQTLVLWEEEGRPVGTAHCFRHVVKEQMHFNLAPLLAKLYLLVLGIVNISGIHCWGMLAWITPGDNPPVPGTSLGGNIGLFVTVLLVLALPVWVLAKLGRDRRQKLARGCLTVYAVSLLILILLHSRLILASVEVIVGDALQWGNSVGAITGKGCFRAALVGTLLACFLSGLPWDDCARHYVQVGRKAGISAVTAGLWSMRQASIELLVLGGGTGLFLVMVEMARISSIPETMKYIVTGNWGLVSAAGVLLLCGASACLSWGRWMEQLAAVKPLLCGAAACLFAVLCLGAPDSLLWIKLLLMVLLIPLLLNLLLFFSLSERFRKIMDQCKKEIEINLK